MTIKDLLSASGITQKELARLSGVNVRQIQKIIYGESKLENVTYKTVSAICAVFGVSPDELEQTSSEDILHMSDVLGKDGVQGLDTEDQLYLLKVEQAKEYSGWRRYPDTCHKLIERIPANWWDKYSAHHIGEVMAMLKTAYDDGVDSHRPE